MRARRRSTSRRRWAVALAAATLVGVLPGSAAAAQPTAADARRVNVLVRFEEQPGRAAVDAIRAAGGKVRNSFHVVPVIAASVPEQALAGLRRNPLVESVEPDGTIVAFDHGPNTGDLEYENAWGVEHIGTPAVHAAGIRGSGIQVAVIDTGIDYIHDDPDNSPYVVDPEFLGNYAGGEDFHSLTPDGPPVLDGDPMDDNGHGTHVAGILAAEKNDYLVVGVAPEVDLYALKVLTADGVGEYSNLIAALEWIIDHNAAHPESSIDVANMSIGGHEVSTSLADAIAATAAAGVVLVGAAGNINPLDWTEIIYGCPVVYPAAYPQVLATTFTNENNALTGYSCTGPEVDFASPGDNIASPVPIGPCMLCNELGYEFLSGTSMASPHLAGTVALLLDAGLADAGPAGLIDDARARLCSTADLGYGVQSGFGGTPIPPNDPRYPNYFGCGVVDADEAVLGLAPPPPGNATPDAVDDNVTTDEESALLVDILTNDTDADDDPLTPSLTSQPQHGTAVLQGRDALYTPAADYSGPDYFTYRVSDGRGGTDDATVYVTVAPINDPPGAVDDAVTTAEDTAVVVEVIGNDSDADFDELTPSVASPPSHGSAAVEGFTIRYTPASNYAGPDSFTYSIVDGNGGSDTATVSVAVTAVNDPPTASAQAVTATAGVGRTISLSGSDVETCELTFPILDLPDHGAIGSQSNVACVPGTPNSDTKSVVYTATAGYAGPDSFTYRTNDGTADSSIVTVSIDVSAPPPATPTVHIGDLDASRTTQSKTWTAIVTVRAENGAHAALAGATVSGSWSAGGSGSGSCTTTAAGTCTISLAGLAKKASSATFSVTNVAHAGSTYQAPANHDPDGSSNGTAIVVSRT